MGFPSLAPGVGTSAIREVLGAMLFYDAEVGFVFTNSSFTNGARALAAKDPRNHLVDRVELAQMIRKVFDREGAPQQNKRAGQVVVAPMHHTAHALTPSPPLTPAAPRQRKPRRTPAQRYEYRRSRRQKPPPLVIVNEPWTVGQWGALIVVLALIVAGLWLYNAGAEQKKWDSIEAAARACQRR